MPFDKERKKRLDWLGTQLEIRLEDGGEVGYGKILNMLQYRYGLTEKKAEEYIRIIVDVKDYRVEQGSIKQSKNEVQQHV